MNPEEAQRTKPNQPTDMDQVKAALVRIINLTTTTTDDTFDRQAVRGEFLRIINLTSNPTN